MVSKFTLMIRLLHFNEAELQAIGLSVSVAIYATLIGLPIALFIAYQIARKDFWGKPALESIIHLPLVMPPVTTGYLLLLLLGSQGFFGMWLAHQFNIKIAFTTTAAVLSSVVVSFPLMVRSIRTSLEMIDPGLEEASRILGAGKIKTFLSITLPLAVPGIVSGTVLAFARSLGEFGATIIFAGNIAGETQTLPLAIYTYMQTPGKESSTFKLVIISAIISLIAMIASEWLIKKMKYAGR